MLVSGKKKCKRSMVSPNTGVPEWMEPLMVEGYGRVLMGCLVSQHISSGWKWGACTIFERQMVSSESINHPFLHCPFVRDIWNMFLSSFGLHRVMPCRARDVPSSFRFDILKALIQNSESSSMIAILLDCVRRELHEEHSRSILVTSGVPEAKVKYSECLSFWSAGVLELVELVLKPPNGGPPSLPEYSDAVIVSPFLTRQCVAYISICRFSLDLPGWIMSTYSSSIEFYLKLFGYRENAVLLLPVPLARVDP
ncbi:hypothetical protein FXO37_28194 [Capsicum annuum]|nr:hypothetical protein FXO37_28194 [Capsicum annuum]